MKIKNKTLAEIAALLKDVKRAAVFCHIRPDGDALGSGLALCAALKNAGKEAYMVCEDVPPAKLCFLPYMNTVLSKIPEPVSAFDTLISVDCADVSRMGQFAGAYSRFQGVTINIDHHVSNGGYAKNNYVYDCTATCEILPEILDAAQFAVTAEMADLMMAGLLTDSGNFSHNDVTEKTFSVAASLKARGAAVAELNYRLFKSQPKARALLYAKVLSKMRFFSDDKIAILTINLDDIKSTGADSTLTEGMVDFPLSIDGVEVAASVMEMKKRQYKVSLRSKGTADVNAVAAKFGGGGHILASGCMLNCDYEEVIERLVFAINQQL